MILTEKQIDFMREDMETGFAYSKIIAAARSALEKQGRDFDKEFADYQKRK